MQRFKLHQKKDEVLIIGDIVLDCYVDCESEFSTNENVTKLKAKRKTYVPGNAANVANNLANLGVSVHLYGAMGMDKAGNQLEGLLNPKIKNHILKTKNRKTPLKTRYLNKDGQILARIDEEEYEELSRAEINYLFHLLDRISVKVGYLVISDLNKGTFNHKTLQLLIKKAKQANISILIDPSYSRPLSSYADCDYIVPNLFELEKITNQKFKNLNEAILCARNIEKVLGNNVVILKADKKGSIFVSVDNTFYFPSISKSVICTIGAGDSFISGFVYSLIINKDIIKSFIYANLSSGISVSKKYTAIVERKELEHTYLTNKVVQGYESVLRESQTK